MRAAPLLPSFLLHYSCHYQGQTDGLLNPSPFLSKPALNKLISKTNISSFRQQPHPRRPGAKHVTCMKQKRVLGEGPTWANGETEMAGRARTCVRRDAGRTRRRGDPVVVSFFSSAKKEQSSSPSRYGPDAGTELLDSPQWVL